MSVTDISSSSTSALSPELLAQLRQARQGSGAEFASSFINEKDQDADGILTATEAGISDDEFTATDSDSDGFITQEEIAARMESRREQDGLMGSLNMLMQGVDTGTLADSLISELDSDGDSMLGLDESGLSEELFNALDGDGDGLLSSDDLAAAMTPPEGAEMASAAVISDSMTEAATELEADSGTGEASSSSSSDDDEEYDEYDFNEDGTVTMDELRQAFLNGDLSLSELFAEGGGQEAGNGSQNALTRLAMRAYEAQSGELSAGGVGMIA